MALTLGFSVLVAILSSTQLVYEQTFDKADSFPFWFAMTALMAMAGTLLNAVLVMRIGMRRLVVLAFGVQSAVSVAVVLVFLSGAFSWAQMFPIWFFWTTAVFFMIGMTFGNLIALALQPLGHIAGMGASMISAISTVLAVFIGGPLGLAFDGTPVPLVSGVAVLAGLACLLLWRFSMTAPDAQTEATL
jgi:DHA1 family bicyclomycin/chloramphenicol resistance-like MFS transporter